MTTARVATNANQPFREFDIAPGSQDRLHQALAPLASPLARFSVALTEQPQNNGLWPSATSRGMAELAAESKWATPKWNEPLRNAHTYGGILVHFLADHLAAMAATIAHSEVGPTYAHLSLLRAVVDVAPTAHWLLDPDIAFEVRIKRSLAYRLDSTYNLARNKHMVGWIAEADRGRNAARLVARHNGWLVERRDGAYVVDGESPPDASRTFSITAFGEPAKDDSDLTLWNYLSGTMHGTFYAISQPLKPASPGPDPLDPTGSVRGVAVDSELIRTFVLLAFKACSTVAGARTRLMGWTVSAEHEKAVADLRALCMQVGEQHRAT